MVADTAGFKEIKMKITKKQLKKIIREEYARLKSQGLIKESEWYSDEHETLADKKFADAQQADQMASQMRDPENLLDDLEMGKEVQMSEEELQAVQELCRKEGLMDYVFEIQNYKNMQIVKLLDDYDDWNQPY
tara:strand:- start:7698 stop:8096 length:399 start_codon:yes stop_codon:yes gene_type:complete